MRQMFFAAWRKFRNKEPMEPLEDLIAAIITQHPEYHTLLEDDSNLDRDYTVEQGQTNPFLHMAMHIAISEQLGTQRPDGIVSIYQTLMKSIGDQHQVEHRMMDCLGEMIWQAQRDGTTPSESVYLECLKKLSNK